MAAWRAHAMCPSTYAHVMAELRGAEKVEKVGDRSDRDTCCCSTA
jgi:hypothetical protein